MTEEIFRADAYARDCGARVVRHGDGGFVLDRTVFYALGGGQPGDRGTVHWEEGAVPVSGALRDGGDILHLVPSGVTPPPEGTEVTARLDWDRRHRLMRVHTALHMLSVVIPLPVTGGQIAEDKGRLDFDMPEAPEDRDALETRLNALIAEDHPVGAEWIDEAELDANPGLVKTMSVQPPRGAGRIRLVRIGAGDTPVDLQPCGGTHVRSTAEIGRVTLGKIEKKGRQNRRVSVLLAD